MDKCQATTTGAISASLQITEHFLHLDSLMAQTLGLMIFLL